MYTSGEQSEGSRPSGFTPPSETVFPPPRPTTPPNGVGPVNGHPFGNGTHPFGTGTAHSFGNGSGNGSGSTPARGTATGFGDRLALATRPRIPQQSDPDDPVAVVWAAKWWILLVAVVVAALTFGISMVLPPTHESSADVRVTLMGQPGSPVSDAVQGANDLASQYAQEVTSDGVILPAAAELGVDAAGLRARTSAGTVSGQNTVQVTVQDRDAGAARRQAQSVADGLVRYEQSRAVGQSATYQRNLAAQLTPIDAQIAAANRELAAFPPLSPDQRGIAQNRLSTLADRRAQVVGQAALQGASLVPQVDVTAAAGPAAKVVPQPALYTVIAALVALFLGVQAALLVGRRRRRRP